MVGAVDRPVGLADAVSARVGEQGSACHQPSEALLATIGPLRNRTIPLDSRESEDLVRIRPKRSFEAVDNLIARTSNPDHVVMLQNLRDHMRAEISADLPALMKTMSANPVYHTYGSGVDAENMNPKGLGETEKFYQRRFDEGTNVLEYEFQRLTVDDWGIAGDGTIHVIYPARAFRTLGMDVDDVDAHYLVSVHQAFFLPYEDGLMAGEDVYSDVAGVKIEKLDPADVVTTEQAFA